MTARWPYDEAHERAWQLFRALSPEARLARMREAGALGLTPQLGDKVRRMGPLQQWRHGVVIGEKRESEPRVFIVHNSEAGCVEVTSLSEFAKGFRVQLIQRAPPGSERGVALRAALLLGSREELASFDVERSTGDAGDEKALSALLSDLGLVADRVVLDGESEWNESGVHYRDARHLR